MDEFNEHKGFDKYRLPDVLLLTKFLNEITPQLLFTESTIKNNNYEILT